MKKVIITVALILGVGLMHLNAQEAKEVKKTNFGIKVEANMSNFIMDDMTGWKSNFGAGASLGGFVRVDIVKFFAIQTDLLFHFKSSDFKIDGVKNNFHFWGAEVPVYANFQFVTKKKHRGYIGIGPYMQVGFSAKNRTLNENYYKNFLKKNDSFMQIGDVGGAVMIGYEFGFGLQINASYKYGFINQLNIPQGNEFTHNHDCCSHHSHKPQENEFMRNQSISFGLGFRF